MMALRWALLVAGFGFTLHAAADQAPDSFITCGQGNCGASFEAVGHMICDRGEGEGQYQFDHYDLAGDYGTPSKYGANARCLRIAWNQLDPINYGMWVYGHCPAGGWVSMYMRDGLENKTCPGVDPQCVLNRMEAVGNCDLGLAAGLSACGLLTYILPWSFPEMAVCTALQFGFNLYCKSQAPTC